MRFIVKYRCNECSQEWHDVIQHEDDTPLKYCTSCKKNTLVPVEITQILWEDEDDVDSES